MADNSMCNAQEKGFVERILRRRQIKKPTCLSLYTVYPVSLSGVLPAFITLFCGYIISLILLCMEKLYLNLCASGGVSRFFIYHIYK